jgi:hypothetical protein
VVLDNFPVVQVPLVATGPLQPPDAVHAVAFFDPQLKAEVPPLGTVVGEADSVTTGMGVITTTSAD